MHLDRNPDNFIQNENNEFYKSLTNKWEDYLEVKYLSVEDLSECKTLVFIPQQPPFNLFENKENNIKLFRSSCVHYGQLWRADIWIPQLYLWLDWLQYLPLRISLRKAKSWKFESYLRKKKTFWRNTLNLSLMWQKTKRTRIWSLESKKIPLTCVPLWAAAPWHFSAWRWDDFQVKVCVSR